MIYTGGPETRNDDDDMQEGTEGQQGANPEGMDTDKNENQ
jgi:hypothetical protein